MAAGVPASLIVQIVLKVILGWWERRMVESGYDDGGGRRLTHGPKGLAPCGGRA